jgi:hypothetical protein
MFPKPTHDLKVLSVPRSAMKDPVEVLRRKQAELERLQEEVDALRLVGKLLKQKPCAIEEQTARGKVIQMPDINLN